MLTTGEYKNKEGQYGLIVYNTKSESEVIVVLSGNVWSSFKITNDGEFAYGNKKAKEIWKTLSVGIKGCTAKNGTPAPFVKGAVSRHSFKKGKTDYLVDKYMDELANAEIVSEDSSITLSYCSNSEIRPKNIPYVKLAIQQEFISEVSFEDTVVVRKLEEIALEKDLSWVAKKKYYIVNDEETAEKIFAYLDNYNGPISYDTETTGLKINMFSKINSKWKRQLEEYNSSLKEGEEPIRADKLVGIIFCVQKDVSYYFPVGNKKFKNLYEGKSAIKDRTIELFF
jgi:hypothetical protein